MGHFAVFSWRVEDDRPYSAFSLLEVALTKLGARVDDDGGARRVFADYTRSDDARRAEPWQLRVMARIPWGRTPRVGTLRAVRAALKSTRAIDNRDA